MKKNILSTDKAPKAIGAYSQGVTIENARLVFVSGQLGLDPATGAMVSGGAAAEARQAMNNLGAILKAAGGDYASIIKTTIYLADIGDFAAVNEIYAGYFTADFPARAAFAVAALPRGGRVEIEAIAAL
ncbi:MAG: RidA family protein [candidate division Zixibacteria bacterium]|nr:RidA family protein [candidate division Zixibacteria bacterium]